MEFALRSDIEAFTFTTRDTVTIIAPELRQTRPVMHSLEADIAENGFILRRTLRQITVRWNFPLAPGFFIKRNDQLFVCTRVRTLMGMHYVLCDSVPTDEPLHPLTNVYLSEAEVSSYNFKRSEPIIITSSESRSAKTAVRHITAFPAANLNAFMLEKTNAQMKRLYFPQKPGFIIEHADLKYITTRIRYAPGKNYLVCDVIPA